MRRLLILITVVLLLTVPVQAMSFTAPEAPQSALPFLPDNSESFSEGLWYIIRAAIRTLQPSMAEAAEACAALVGTCVLISLLTHLSGSSKSKVEMIGTIGVAMILLQPTKSMIQLGVETVQEISQYGKLLLPVMTGALAALGAVTKSGALYMATAFFDALLSSGISQLLTPLIYIYVCLCIGCNLFDQELIESIRSFMKWLMTWALKTILYVFTGYISITGVVGGVTDAAMLKATKLTITGMVPVVGNILSDASEAVLVSAGVMKSTVGVYGLLVILALWIGPFMRIGVQYLLLKITSGICLMFGTKKVAGIIKDFSSTMGLTLAMIGAVCIIQMISTICFMKGVG